MSTKDFVTSFPFRTLHAVNLLLWNTILSFQNYYSNQTKRTSQGVLYGGSGFATEEVSLNSCPKYWISASLWMSLHTKNWVLPFSFMPHPILLQTLYWKKVGLRVFRQILQTILSVVYIFSFIITTYLKPFSGMKTLSKKQRPAELSLWIITRVYPILPKMFPFLSSYLLPVPRIGCPVLLPNLWRKPCIRERSPPSSQKVLTFETRKIPITK